MASSISDVISRHSNGRPEIVHLYEQSSKKIVLKEKQYFYENGQFKAKGIFIGSDEGRWTFYSSDGKKLMNPIELIDKSHQSIIDSILIDLTLTDFTFADKIKSLERAISKVQDNQKIILQKIESLEKSDSKKDNKPKADPNKVYNVAVGNSVIKGNPNAKVTITEWMDFQ